MADDHFRCIELHLPIDEFHRLPRNSAYKYEYFDSRAVLSPRPKYHQAVLDLQPLTDIEPCDIRPLPPGAIVDLAELFRAAFHRTQPFAALNQEDARKPPTIAWRRLLAGATVP